VHEQTGAYSGHGMVLGSAFGLALGPTVGLDAAIGLFRLRCDWPDYRNRSRSTQRRLIYCPSWKAHELNGFFEESLLWEGNGVRFIVGFNEWVLKGWLAGQVVEAHQVEGRQRLGA
jgi:hypothetical protein